MTCDGCMSQVEKVLKSHESINEVNIDFESAKADIVFDTHVDFEELKKLFEGSNYMIHTMDERVVQKSKPVPVKGAKYYFPMHCEGGKTYDEPRDCPVCGMDLVPDAKLNTSSQKIYLSNALRLRTQNIK